MKKTLALFLAVTILTISVVSLASCDLFKSIELDETKANLEAAGYTVTVISGSDYVLRDDAVPSIMSSELSDYLYAVKGDEEIHVFFFYSIEDASDNYDFINYNNLRNKGQNNNVAYIGTSQAVKDAKI